MAVDLVVRTAHRLRPDPGRVITKLFVPGEETPRGRSRASAVIGRIMALDEAEVAALADAVIADFRGRHRDLTGTFSRNFAVVAHDIPGPRRLSAERRMLIGACFTHEYAPEGAALFNPSMAAHPDQSGLAEGQLRFVMTVRCVGEGHLSSIGFRTGVVGSGNALTVDEPGPRLALGAIRRAVYQRSLLLRRLADYGEGDGASTVLGGLPEAFTADQLSDAINGIHEHTLNRERMQQTIDYLYEAAAATYDVEFPVDSDLSERLLWPNASVESHGMEDARLVRFSDDGAPATYYATYTAYDGARVASHLFATKDFRQFHVSPMAGQGAQNKGFALFPRRIGGRFFALSRWDRENTAIVDSDNCRIWDGPRTLHVPGGGRDLIQVGNCGPPIETPAGWLVLTHSVGPMRTYALGAILLDLADPSVLLATLPQPLLTPSAGERDGYVPNVVYSCGSLLHNDVLTIPYGISDAEIGFAQVNLPELLRRMVPPAVSADRGLMPPDSNGTTQAGLADLTDIDPSKP
jgi:predicted GH43/DUF377 family glycosyl hydrolase